MKNEIWKDIEGFPGYQVSSKGQVRCFRDFRGNITDQFRMLKPLLNKDNYYYVDLYTVDHKPIHKRIHRLVADAFLGPNPNLVVNHIDGNKHNNDISNIEWVTAKENSSLAAANGLYKTKSVKIVETGEIFDSFKQCAETLGIHPSTVCDAISGKIQSAKGLHFELTDNKKPAPPPFLYDHQKEALKKMFNGCVLNGGVGSGKSRTALYYYFSKNGGEIGPGYYNYMKDPPDLYIITTARKRDTLDWEKEMVPFLMGPDSEASPYSNKIVVDSWNNIKKYQDVTNAQFIFDEDRVTGSGVWVKAFLKIAKSNEWIILSATPGDTYLDYVPVFIANGFYRNKTEFTREHVIYSRYCKFPKVDRYIGTARLDRLKSKILIDMDFERHTIPHHEDVYVNYDISKYKDVMRKRWDPFKDEPIQQAAGLCYVLRKIVNSDESRQRAVLELFEDHPKMIIFYSFDYEREILLNLYYGDDVEVAEWTGHAHQPLPTSKRWVYLCQYTSACEGWNCITTDTIVFYSQNYSYKVLAQAFGRIDRLNTPFMHLYYYHLKSRSGIDLAISKALREKKKFNERKFTKWE